MKEHASEFLTRKLLNERLQRRHRGLDRIPAPSSGSIPEPVSPRESVFFHSQIADLL
jgi:hypothetical protein